MTTNVDSLVQSVDILVVDDSIDSLRMLTEILRIADYRVRPIENPQLALASAREQPPSLILLDVKMPKMSGFELCRRLKQDERTRDVPIIFVSALENTEDRVRGFKVGAVDFISKPIQEQEVLARVKAQLKLRFMQLHLEELVAERTAELEKLLDERSRALDSAEAQIRLLFENSPIGIALSTVAGEILIVNQKILNMMRISEEEIRRRGAIPFYADQADRQALLAELQESGSAYKFGLELLRHDGQPFFANLSMNQLVLQGDEVILVMAEDVTDELAAEQELAANEERERLARELHDAVTQTLFAASVLAHTSPSLMDKNPTVARQNMEQLEILIHGALAEMRTLVLELRPDGFAENNISQLIDLLVESTRARTHAKVSLNVEISCSPPEDVTITLYRIAQESLNNVAKHALASEVFVDLTCDPKGAILTIKDDGRGFDPSIIPAGHFGLNIMRERSLGIGANIKIESEVDGGTLVYVSWSASGDETEHE